MGQDNFNPSYIGTRSDILAMVDPSARVILDVGCSIGSLGRTLQERNGAEVYGVELSPEMGAEAAKHLRQVFVGDAAAIINGDTLGDLRFDTIIFADVLEHLADPWTVLRSATRYLKPGGSIVTSLPNIRHIDTLFHLIVLGRWPYRERGIHDRTHLRFFTLRNVRELFAQADLRIEKLATNYRIVEKPHRINGIARFLAWPGLRGLLAFQYLVRARKA